MQRGIQGRISLGRVLEILRANPRYPQAMTPHSWSKASSAVPPGEAGALTAWAVDAVDALHYVCDLDELQYGPGRVLEDYSLPALDLIHVRWATATAITALDLCAAALGQLHEPAEEAATRQPRGKRWDLSLRNFTKNERRLEWLPSAAQVWVQEVAADPRYILVLNTRNPFTHSRAARRMQEHGLPRTVRDRFEIKIGNKTTTVDARELIVHATDLTTAHVERFLTKAVWRAS